MHVDAAAKTLRRDHRRKARAQSLAPGDGAHQLAHQQRPVGGGETHDRAAVHLVLAGAAFRLEGLGLQACALQRRDQHGAEGQGPFMGDDAVVGAGPVQSLDQIELLLEGGQEAQPEAAFEIVQRAPQKGPEAGFPGGAVGCHAVADIGVEGRPLRPEIDPHAGIAVGREPDIAERTPGARREGRERAYRLRHRDPADPRLEALLQVGRGEGAPAHEAGQVGPSEKDQLLAPHRHPRLAVPPL